MNKYSIIYESKLNNFSGVKKLLKYGYSPNIENNGGLTPLMYSYINRNRKIFNLLLEYGADFGYMNRYDRSLIINITLNDDLRWFKYCFKIFPNCCELNFNYCPKTTILHIATHNKSYKILKYLLDSGYDPNIKNELGSTPILSSLYKQDYSHRCYNLLLKYGADLHVINNNNESLLHVAVKSENFSVVKKCVKIGLDLNLINLDGRTPFLESLQTMNFKIIKYLIKCGVEKTYLNIKGHFVFDTQSLIILDGFVKKDFTKVFKFLFKNGLDKNMVDLDGDNLLHYYINTDIDLCEYFIQCGVDFYKKNNKGKTPIELVYKNIYKLNEKQYQYLERVAKLKKLYN